MGERMALPELRCTDRLRHLQGGDGDGGRMGIMGMGIMEMGIMGIGVGTGTGRCGSASQSQGSLLWFAMRAIQAPNTRAVDSNCKASLCTGIAFTLQPPWAGALWEQGPSQPDLDTEAEKEQILLPPAPADPGSNSPASSCRELHTKGFQHCGGSENLLLPSSPPSLWILEHLSTSVPGPSFIPLLQQSQSLLPPPCCSSFAKVLPKAAELDQDPCWLLGSRMTFRGTLGALPKELPVAWGLDLSSLGGSGWSSTLRGVPEFSQLVFAVSSWPRCGSAAIPNLRLLAQPECRWGMCWAWMENSMAKILQHLHLLIALDSTNHKTPVAVDNCNFLQIATAALLIDKYTRTDFT
ncbi:hypothetical protein DUI87_34994 [Hirundo rustica rustica]|uniref:Uncharacterized protein n=1 Tax=Hirundo rustica rustica TaxID=333673 RepID=A0A3M0IIR7_HIRRU|nr:hypothetical protein DUI87_34994 [Hirundo rustica rustica]